MWSIASCTTTSNQVTSKQPAHLYKYYNWSAHLLLSKKKLSPNFPPICARSQIAILSVLLWLPMHDGQILQTEPATADCWIPTANANTKLKYKYIKYNIYWLAGAAFANRHSSAVPWLSSTNTDVASPGFKHLCTTHQCVVLRSNKFKSNGCFFSRITLQAGPLPWKSQTYNIYHLANLANKSKKMQLATFFESENVK